MQNLCDLCELSKSRQSKTRLDSGRNSYQDLGGQKLADILAEIHAEILAKIHAEILTKISGRSQNLGSKKLAENLGMISSKISARFSSRYQNLGGKKTLFEKLDVCLAILQDILHVK